MCSMAQGPTVKVIPVIRQSSACWSKVLSLKDVAVISDLGDLTVMDGIGQSTGTGTVGAEGASYGTVE